MRIVGAAASPLRLYERMVAAQPDAAALEWGDARWTYAVLDAEVDRVAAALAASKVRPGDRVVVTAERTGATIAAILASLRVGACFVPLDSRSPDGRLRQIVLDASPRVLVGDDRAASRCGVPGLPKASRGESPRRLPLANVPDHELAYILYTSGSTGVPKGVEVERVSLSSYLPALVDALQVRPGDRYLHSAAFTFSASVRQTLFPLSVGATLCLASDTEAADVFHLVEHLARARVTIWDTTPTVLTTALEGLATCAPALRSSLIAHLRLVLVTGEPLLWSTARAWRDALRRDLPIVNLYSQTESSGTVALYALGDESGHTGVVPIGRPLAGADLSIRNADATPVAPGQTGEIYVLGDRVARGYRGQPEQSGRSFVELKGRRAYRTGDLATADEAGVMRIIGRADRRIKLRGFRIEPEEIERALVGPGGAQEAAVLLVDGERPRLVAYVGGAGKATGEELRARLAMVLPAYMVPAEVVVLARLPLSAHGKLDRASLRALAPAARRLAPPATELESQLCGLWSQVLGCPVGVDEDFFELGGDSLGAARLLARVAAELGRRATLGELMEHGCPRDFAKMLTAGVLAIAPSGPTPHPPNGGEPLSFTQEGIWLIDQVLGSSPMYAVDYAFRMSGELDLRALERALQTIVRRHAVLRTTYRLVDTRPLAFSTDVDLEVVPEHRPEIADVAARDAMLAEWSARPFDLERGPLLRAALWQRDSADHVLAVTAHHIVTDGWSRGIFARELETMYARHTDDQAVPILDPGLRFADFARWQRERIEGNDRAALVDFWRAELAEAPPTSTFRTRTAPPQLSYRGDRVAIAIDDSIAVSARDLAARCRTTPFAVLITALFVQLAIDSGQRDLVIGTPVAGRSRPELEGLIGPFVNMLAIRTSVDLHGSFTAALGLVRERCHRAQAHEELPYEMLVRELKPRRFEGHSPIFQSVIVFQTGATPAPRLPGLELRALAVANGYTKFDLTMNLRLADDSIDGFMEYRVDLYERQRAEQIAAAYVRILGACVTSPSMPLEQLVMRTDS